MEKIIITKENANQRIDKFLAKEFFSYTRGEIIKLLNDNQVAVNHKKIKPSYRLRENDFLEIKFSKTKKAQFLIANKNIPVEIIFQDKNIAVINKPSGLTVHPTNISESDTLVNGLIYLFPEMEKVGDGSKGSELRPGIVHRLDKNTSGVMVIAKNQKTYEALKKLFQNRKISKEYAVITHGHFEEKTGIISLPIAKAKNYKKQIVANGKTKTKILPAITKYKVMKEFAEFSLVSASPKTGRMHQIRLHMLAMGNPVVGDALYKGKGSKVFEGVKRQMLHAKKLNFTLNGKKHSFSAPLPEDMLSFLASLDEKRGKR